MLKTIFDAAKKQIGGLAKRKSRIASAKNLRNGYAGWREGAVPQNSAYSVRLDAPLRRTIFRRRPAVIVGYSALATWAYVGANLLWI